MFHLIVISGQWHEILKYKLNNLHVLIFLHVVCFYFACKL